MGGGGGRDVCVCVCVWFIEYAKRCLLTAALPCPTTEEDSSELLKCLVYSRNPIG